MSLDSWKLFAETMQGLATAIALVVGGGWAFYRFRLQADRYAHVQSSAEIRFIGRQDDQWIIELAAILENKGKVEHRINDFTFDFDGLAIGSKVDREAKWGDQINFGTRLARGSFLPASFKFFSVGPGVTARYSHITAIPDDIAFVMLHCRFRYADRPDFSHAMEATAKVPTVALDDR